MLKFCLSTVFVFAVIFQAYAPPAYATSADLMMTQIQAGGAGAATEELIVLYNNGSEPVDITHYCVTNKSDVAFACFDFLVPGERLMLPSNQFATIASSSLLLSLGSLEVTLTYEPTNQSSGSITGSSDTISLINPTGEVVDQHSWTSSIIGGMLFARNSIPEWPPYYFDTDMADDWTIQSPQFIPDDQTVIEAEVLEDLCSNIEGEQYLLPDGMEVNELGECTEIIVIPPLVVMITELLPNVSGADDGNEFIELYNPNNVAVNLSDYLLEVGMEFEYQFCLPDELLEPGAYRTLFNSEVAFTLRNTTSQARIVTQAGEPVFTVPFYVHPKDDESWALVGDEWMYTNQPTPTQENKVNTPEEEPEQTATSGTTLKPCNANQYRSPETNRCRLIQTPTVPKPCEPDQERNPETNRCRKIAVATTPTPCEEGKERHPETNRCRTVVQTPEADYAVLGAETKSSPSMWYVWFVIAGVVVALLIYAAWEWRSDVRRIIMRLRRK